jgi:hypothetical protein
MLAQHAGISDRTLAKVEYISEHADEVTKEKLRSGEKGTSIDKEYNRLKAEVEQPTKPKKTKGDTASRVTVTIDASYLDPQTPIGAFAKVSPYHLFPHLTNFSDTYLNEAIMLLLENLMGTPNRKKGAKRIINNILKKYGQQS